MPINVSWITKVRDGKHLLDNGRPWLFPQWILKCFISSSFKLLAVEVSLGRLFHSLMYLVIKKYLLLFRLNFSVAYSYQISSTHHLLLLNYCHSSHIFILSRHQSINQYSPPCLVYAHIPTTFPAFCIISWSRLSSSRTSFWCQVPQTKMVVIETVSFIDTNSHGLWWDAILTDTGISCSLITPLSHSLVVKCLRTLVHHS